MRKITMVLVLIAIIIGFSLPAQAADTVNVIIDGRTIEFTDAPAYIDQNGRTQVPTRFVGEALGALVDFDSNTNQASFSRRSPIFEESEITTVGVQIGSTEYYVQVGVGSSKKLSMDTKAVIEKGRTYIPVRYIAEAFGADIKWDPKTSTVIITSKTKGFRGFEVPQSFTDEVYLITHNDEDYQGVAFELDFDGGRGAMSLTNRIGLLFHILTQKLEQKSINRLNQFTIDNCPCVLEEMPDDFVVATFLDERSEQVVRIYRTSNETFQIIIYDKSFIPPDFSEPYGSRESM